MKSKRLLALALSVCLLFSILGISSVFAADMYGTFKNPPMELKSRPLWFWNGISNSATMDRQNLIDTVNNSVGSGYGGFGILPYNQGGYLSEAYFDMYGTVVEECAKTGMKINLYDENGFPSGPAGGLFASTYPNDTSKALYKEERDVVGPKADRINVNVGTENEPLMGVTAMNMDTKEIRVLDIHQGEPIVPTTYTTTASSSFFDMEAYNGPKATDGNSSTRWNAGDRSGNNQWLQIEFPAEKTFNSMYISEAYDRARSFHIQYWDGSAWQNAYAGTTIGDSKNIEFSAVTSSKVRLFVDTITNPTENSLTIWELDVLNNGSSLLRTGGDYVLYDLPAGDWKIMMFSLRKDGNNFCDYLDPADVTKFINITHQKYYDHFAEYFGNTIDMTFYDEPALWRSNTWTEKYNQKFEAKFGFDPVMYYPAMWYDIGEDTAAARSLLFGFRAELYANGFTKTLADWCDAHNIELTGHVGEEELVNASSTVGDLMLAFRDQHIPGIDSVIFYGRISRALKIVSSAANNWDKQRVMVEIHGASDTLDVPTMYRDVMDHYAKGINFFVPHAIWYAPYGSGFMNPELSWRDAKWGPGLPDYNSYIGRVGSLLQVEGRHVADIGVLYPIYSLHSGMRFDGEYDRYKGTVTPKAQDNYMDIGERLSYDVRKDFTYLHPDVINQKCTVDGDTLKMANTVNYESFKTLIIPGGDTISLPNLQKIYDFYKNGGLVIGSRQLPYLSAELGKNQDVVDIITDMFGVNPKTSFGPLYSSSSQYEVGWMGDTIGLEPWKAADDNLFTRWESTGTANEWLQVDFNAPQAIGKAVIKERNNAARSFKLQTYDGTSWVDIDGAAGTTIGAEKTLTFAPVTTSKIRLLIPSAAQRLSISEFTLFDANGNNLTFPDMVSKDHASGGKAIFIPNDSAALLDQALDSKGTVYDVDIDDSIKTTGGNLSYIHKVVDGKDAYFIANSSDNKLNTTVTIRGTIAAPAVWDPHTGDKYKVSATYDTISGVRVTKVALRLAPVRSVFIMDDATAPVKLYTTDLEAAIEAAKALKEADIFAGTYAPVKTALQNAEAALDSATTQQQIDDAEIALNDAIAGVRYRNLALNKPMSVKSTLDSGDFNQRHLTDGNHSTPYTSNGQPTVQHEEWANIDLGKSEVVDNVWLFPRNDGQYTGFFFPEDYKIELSLDGQSWSEVANVVGYAQPTTADGVKHEFYPQRARYVRVTGTKLRRYPGIDANYRMALNEIEVYGPEIPTTGELVAAKKKVLVGEGTTATFDFKIDDIKNANTGSIEFTYDPSIVSFQSLTFADGTPLMQILKTDVDGKCKIVFGSQTPFSTEDKAPYLRLTFGKLQDEDGVVINVAITSLKLGTVDEQDSTAQIAVVLDKPSASTEIFSALRLYDINKDGKISISDLSVCMKYYTYSQSHPDWNKAEKCDLNGDGIVDMADLIIISSIIS